MIEIGVQRGRYLFIGDRTTFHTKGILTLWIFNGSYFKKMMVVVVVVLLLLLLLLLLLMMMMMMMMMMMKNSMEISPSLRVYCEIHLAERFL